MLAIIKACVVPITTIISECWEYNFRFCSEGLTRQAVNLFVSFVVHQCLHKHDHGHVEACKISPQALTKKTKLIVW